MGQLSLAEFVDKVMREKDFSTYDVERNAKKTISQSHIHRVRAGVVTNLSTDKLRALAAGLGVAEEELLAITLGQRPHVSKMAEEKIASVVSKLDALNGFEREYALLLINLLDRELDRLLTEGM